jgi:hypothetical protein
MRTWAALLAVLAVLAAPLAAYAQEAPIPMPRRPDRMPPGFEPPPETPDLTTGTFTEPETAAEAVEAVVTERQPVVLTAQITEDGEAIPEGVVWRVFDTRTDSSGELALAAKSDDAMAHLSLAPGEYVVHVAYGQAQASDTLTVKPGENAKALILDAGALRLNAAVTGDVPIPLNLLQFDVFATGDGGENVTIAEGLNANDIVTLNAGTYHVVSRFGTINAVVRADLRIEPGQMTEATLYHRASQVAFKLVSEPGGEAIADVEWTVQTPDGQTVFSDLGAFPATVLAEGDYVVIAKRGETVFNREFEVQPGPSRDVEVLTTVY